MERIAISHFPKTITRDDALRPCKWAMTKNEEHIIDSDLAHDTCNYQVLTCDSSNFVL
jgi:hypothetical protein